MPRASVSLLPISSLQAMPSVGRSVHRLHLRRIPFNHCLIAGTPTMIYRRGLELRDPVAYAALARVACESGYCLKEDQRSTTLPVLRERRARWSMMAISSLMLASTAVTAG